MDILESEWLIISALDKKLKAANDRTLSKSAPNRFLIIERFNKGVNNAI